MTRYIFILFTALIFSGCKKDKEEQTVSRQTTESKALVFTPKNYTKKTTRPCKDACTEADISILVAQDVPVVADSINKKIFSTVRNIVYFGEKPTNAATYDEITDSFIKSYDELAGKFPDEAIPWEAVISTERNYESQNLINITINNYMYTGGAHGYEGKLSLIFDTKTGKSLMYKDFIKDVNSFTAYAEKKFRAKYKIAQGMPINSTGLTFTDEKFTLPLNIFFTKNGLLLVYNTYEISSFAEGDKEVLLPYSEADAYLKIK